MYGLLNGRASIGKSTCRSARGVPVQGEIAPGSQGLRAVKTVDISASGIGLISPDPLPAKHLCELHISTLHQGEPKDIALKGTVAYCILSGTLGFRVGLQYTEVDPHSKSVITHIIEAAG